MVSRRVFLKNGAFAFVSLGFAPSFLSRTALAATGRSKQLIAIFQRGAVDGLSMRHPSAFAFGTEYFHHRSKRDGPRAAISGSTRPSRTASATSRAVSGASSTPFR